MSQTRNTVRSQTKDKMRQKSLMAIKDESWSSNSSQPRINTAGTPDPRYFEIFLPWACKQFNASRFLNIRRLDKRSNILKSNVSNLRLDSRPEPLPVNLNTTSFVAPPVFDPKDAPVLLETTYTDDNLIQLKFNKCYHIPCQLYNILVQVLKYHRFLTTLIINSGLDATGVVYIGKLLVESSLTEVILDGCYVREANYYILLEKPGGLSLLSLARCQIDDEIVQKLCAPLEFNGAASKTLNVLNLSSNKITDKGAACIGYCLRTNRKLKCLNLANNTITDRGVKEILKSLKNFELNAREIHTRNACRFPELLTLCNDMHVIAKDVKAHIFGRKSEILGIKTSVVKRPRLSKRNLKSKSTLTTLSDDFSYLFKKAVDAYKLKHGESSVESTYPEIIKLRNGKFSTNGNNILCSLNLAYNHLTGLSLLNILNVLDFQIKHFSYPNGLLRLQLDGNLLPKIGHELMEIDRLLKKKIEDACKSSESYPSKRRISKAIYKTT